jgi:predicted lipid-binding transport protein (Tim44 family)
LMQRREFSFTGKVGVLLLLLTVIFLPFSSSICIAAESAASAASEGAETVPVAPAKKPVVPETPAVTETPAAAEMPVPGEAVAPAKETAPVEPAAEDVAAAGEAGEGATKGLKGANTIWYIAGGAAFLGLIALGLGGGGGGGTTSKH